MERPNLEAIKPKEINDGMDAALWYQQHIKNLEAYCDYLEQQVKNSCLGDIVGSYSLKVGDNIELPSGLKAEVIETKVKVKDEFNNKYYLFDAEVG